MSAADKVQYVDRNLSASIAAQLRTVDKQCYLNAARTVFFLNDEGDDTAALYVEGFAVTADIGLVMAHAWVELSDGTIIDATPAYHQNDRVVYYWPAARYTAGELLKALRKNDDELPVAVVEFRRAPRTVYEARRAAWLHALRMGGNSEERIEALLNMVAPLP